MKIRGAVIHLLLILGLVIISFVSVLMYQFNPEVREFIKKYNPAMDFSVLVRTSLFTLGALLVNIYLFYFFIFELLILKRPILKNCFFSFFIVTVFVISYWYLSSLVTIEKLKATDLIPSFISCILFGGIGIGMRALSEYFKNKEKRKELERKSLQSEVNLLRSQINPHFLFNTLNNIDAMIRKDSEKASDLLIKLSTQMRYMLYDSNTERIAFASEIEFIRDYIELQKLRIKNQLAVNFIVEGDYQHQLIPPMLFVPFIENAFKHCSDFELDNAITIRLRVNEGHFVFETKNLFESENELSEKKTGGLGIDLAKKRLRLLYPDNHRLSITNDAKWFCVTLKIELHED